MATATATREAELGGAAVASPRAPALSELPALPTLRFPAECPLTDDLLLRISSLNDGLRFERDAEGALVIRWPEGGESSEIESEFNRLLGNWRRGYRNGRAYSSSAGIRRPDGSVRQPDAAWISDERLGDMSRAERRGIIAAIPDFVVEVRSPSDQLAAQQAKMAEWIGFGVRLGVLVDPDDRLVFVYRPGREVERLERPSELSAEPELPGFTIDFEEVWALIGEDD